ncbi:BcsR/BcsP family cellulose biosynthesis protein [Alcaligenes sp. SDU_A2]|uniref:BcsR/BcsP family cellulose biosynthesis protein n=1 Tax=Alcaligenes sp. SDU_A2 TaxID=3136634 RepID=UPI00311E5485
MSKINDISNLFGEIGADASGYRDLAADNQLSASLDRWPLLATVHGHRPSDSDTPAPTLPAGQVSPLAALSGAASKQAPQSSADAPVSGLFKRMAQPEPAVRQEPVFRQVPPAPSVAPVTQQTVGLQTLFARLEGPAQPAQGDEAGLSLFQRLLRK